MATDGCGHILDAGQCWDDFGGSLGLRCPTLARIREQASDRAVGEHETHLTRQISFKCSDTSVASAPLQDTTKINQHTEGDVEIKPDLNIKRQFGLSFFSDKLPVEYAQIQGHTRCTSPTTHNSISYIYI